MMGMNGEGQPGEKSTRNRRGSLGIERFPVRKISIPLPVLLAASCWSSCVHFSCSHHPCQAWSWLSPLMGARGAQDCLASTHAGSVPSAVLPAMREPLPIPGTWLLCPVSRHSPDALQIASVKVRHPPAPLSVWFGFTGFACFLRQGLFCSLG